jgi:hypothetical protein
VQLTRIDIRLDVVQISRILGHARTSMTLDSYTHLFEQARIAELRAELAKSEFANLLTGAFESSPLAGPHLRHPRRAATTRQELPATAAALPSANGLRAPALLDKNLTNRFRQQNGQRV